MKVYLWCLAASTAFAIGLIGAGINEVATCFLAIAYGGLIVPIMDICKWSYRDREKEEE